MSGEIARIDARIAALQSEINADQARAAELGQQCGEALGAADAAEEKEAAALADGRPMTELGAGGDDHARRADRLARAIKQLNAKIAAAKGQTDALKEQTQPLLAELAGAELHAAQAEWDAFESSQLMPLLDRVVTAKRRAHGYGSASIPDLERSYRNWEAQQAEREEAQAS